MHNTVISSTYVRMFITCNRVMCARRTTRTFSTPHDPPSGLALVAEAPLPIAHHFCRLGEGIHMVKIVVDIGAECVYKEVWLISGSKNPLR